MRNYDGACKIVAPIVSGDAKSLSAKGAEAASQELGFDDNCKSPCRKRSPAKGVWQKSDSEKESILRRGQLTPILLKSITIHLPFLSRYFCKSMPSSWQKVVYTPPICIAIRLPFVSRYFFRSIRVRGRWDTPYMIHRPAPVRSSSLPERFFSMVDMVIPGFWGLCIYHRHGKLF